MKTDAGLLVVAQPGFMESSMKAFFAARGFSRLWVSGELGLDATIQPPVYDFFQKEKPAYVILGSVLSGGILANTKAPADFIYRNIQSQANVIYAAWKFGVRKLIYVGASCMYPAGAAQPIKETSLLTGELEKTSEPYAVAKIAGVKLCQAFAAQHNFAVTVIVPATVYGPQGHVDPDNSHVLSALVAKFATAAAENEKSVTVWGSGNPRREFIYIDDFLNAVMLLLEKSEGKGEVYNAGAGEDISIKELTALVAKKAGYKGEIQFDTVRPDGAGQKLLDVSRIRQLGFQASVKLEDGIEKCFRALKVEQKV